jgi:hypothetical protein
VSGKMGDNDHLAQFKNQDSGLLTELGEIIAMAILHLANKTVNPKPFEQARNLPRIEMKQMLTKGAIGEHLNDKLTA